MGVTDVGTVQSIRSSVEAIVLPDAAALPRNPLKRLPSAEAVALALGGTDLSAPGGRDLLLRSLHAALGRLPRLDAWAADRRAVDVGRAAEPHDAYFRVARSREAPPLAYPRALLQGLAAWATELDDAGPDADAASVGAALADLWSAAFDLDESRPAWAAAAGSPGTRDRDAPAAVGRWIRGHQVFAVLTQGLVWTLHRFAAAADDAAAAQAALQRVVRLYDASAAAFRFTADFDAEHYTGLIRPSMSEPHAPAGFSGTMSPDHGHLVGLLTSLRTPLAQAAHRFPAEAAEMKASLAQLYDDHKRVCTRLAGIDGPSLRSVRAADQPAAAEMLDRFLARRLAILS